METGQIRSALAVVPETLPHRPTQAPPAAAPLTAAAVEPVSQTGDTATLTDDRSRSDRAASASTLKTRYDRDLSSGTMVYQWIDQITEAVVMQIPKAETVTTVKRVYTEVPANRSQTQTKIDRSV